MCGGMSQRVPAVIRVGIHPVGAALPRRIDDREVIVRIRTEPFPVILQGRACGFEMTIRLTFVLRLKQESHLDARQ